MLPADVARALSERRAEVTTSRPAPADFSSVYAGLVSSGHEVVSVHLSSRLSGTYSAACSAAAPFDGSVVVIDSGSTGMGLGFPVLAAASSAASGGGLDEVREAAEAAIERTTTLFYVDTLEFLRRGGRIGAASALVGTALAVKPILHVAGGEIVARDKVRTAGRALARLIDLAADAAGESDVDIAVHHVAAPERAALVLARLEERLRTCDRYVVEAGAVVAAHVGPGFAGVVVHRRADRPA